MSECYETMDEGALLRGPTAMGVGPEPSGRYLKRSLNELDDAVTTVCSACPLFGEDCLLIRGEMCMGPLLYGQCDAYCLRAGLSCKGGPALLPRKLLKPRLEMLIGAGFSIEEILDAGRGFTFGELQSIEELLEDPLDAEGPMPDLEERAVKTVCSACPLEGEDCLLARGEMCMGPLFYENCDAYCIEAGLSCKGCEEALLPEEELRSALEVYRLNGFTMKDILEGTDVLSSRELRLMKEVMQDNARTA